MKLSITKKHLIDKRNTLMMSLFKDDYDNADIAVIFNLERSWVTRIINSLKKKSLRDTKK